jgi:hypothetical protein
MQLSAAGLGHACLICDDLWPCDVAILLRVVSLQDDRYDELYAGIEEAALDEQMARTVFAAWKDEMLTQNRDIGSRTSWLNLSEEDKQIDKRIAESVIDRALERASTGL